MVDVKEAVRIAAGFVQEIYFGEDVTGPFLLEEVQFAEDGSYWLVTISFSRPKVADPMGLFAGASLPRDYKVVKVDARDGRIHGMTMRAA